MRSDFFRFPDVSVSVNPELFWVLDRAFGPTATGAAGPVDGARATALAWRLSVASRIGCRIAPPCLEAEIGGDGAAALRDAFHGDAAQAVVLLAVAREVAERAGQLGIPCVLLKFCALQLDGVLTLGSRSAGDVDILVPERAGREFCAALVAAGYRQDRGWAGDHQFSPLHHPGGPVVEVHRAVPGVLPGLTRRAATLDDLLSGGMLRAAPEVAPTTLLPVREFLVLHALVHGLAQHGMAPYTYPPLRVIADLNDLGVGPDEWRALANGSAPLLGRVLSPAELEAASGVSGHLQAGSARELLAGQVLRETLAARLLRHMLAGAVDGSYVGYLRARNALRARAGESQVWFITRKIARVIVTTPLAIEKRHGIPRSRWELAWRVLTRPFELLWELRRQVGRVLSFRPR